MKKLCFLAIVAVMAIMVSCKQETENTETQNQAKNPEDKTLTAKSLSPEMQTLRIGMELANFGYANKSPEALIEAANILASVATTKLDATVERGSKAEQQTEETPRLSYTPEQLLASAREMAGEDETLISMIEKVESKIATTSAERGNVTGATRTTEERILANDYDQYRVEFVGGDLAACSVIGNGTTDLDVYVYDEEGNLVAEDTDYSDQCYCSWNPEKQGIFTIKIVNRGEVYNDYTLMVN